MCNVQPRVTLNGLEEEKDNFLNLLSKLNVYKLIPYVIDNCFTSQHEWSHQTTENSVRDARTPQPGGKVFNTMRYRSCETIQRSGYFQSSVSYIKLQIMFK